MKKKKFESDNKLESFTLTKDELEKIKDKICSQSDEDLLKMVKIDFADYREESIKFAKEELEKRNIKVEDIEKDDIESKIYNQKDEVRLKEKVSISTDEGISVKWLNFYIRFLLPLGIIMFIFRSSQLIIKEDPIVTILIILIFVMTFFIFYCFVFWGLYKHHLWGWKINWILLGIDTLSCPLRFSFKYRCRVLKAKFSTLS